MIIVIQLGHLLTRCLYQVVDDRNNCVWISTILYMLSTIKTTSSFDFSTMSLGPRESIVSIELRSVIPPSAQKKADCKFLHVFVSPGHRPPSFHDNRQERFEIRCPQVFHEQNTRPTHSNLLGLASKWTTATGPTCSSIKVGNKSGRIREV